MSKLKKSEENSKPKVHQKLTGFEMEIDKFGEIKSNFDIDKINQFLNNHVKDKKLNDQEESAEKAD